MPLDLSKPLQVRWQSGATSPVTDVVRMNDALVHAYWGGVLTLKAFAAFKVISGQEAGGGAVLENIPQQKRIFERWVNVYPNGTSGGVHITRESADEFAEPDRIACLHIRHEYTEGEGL